MKRPLFTVVAATSIALAAGLAAQSPAPKPARPKPLAAFTGGNLVVLRVGDGGAALSSNAAAVFLDEYTTAGTSVQSIAVPSTTAGGRLTIGGTSSSEGGLNRSTDGNYLCFAGYDQAVGSVTTGVNRVVGRAGTAASVDVSTAIGDGFLGSSVRSVASVDGTAFWVAGNSSPSGSGGVRYVPFGNTPVTATTQVLATPNNMRHLAIWGGQLYGSSGSSPYVGVNTIGTGLPTSSGQTATLIAATATATNPYAIVILDRNAAVAGLDTLYVADQTTGNGIRKYSWDGTAWTARGNVTGTSGVTGLVGRLDVSGNAVLYATMGTSAGNTIVTVTDAAASDVNMSGTFSTVATAGANTAFRGIAFAPGTSLPVELTTFGIE